MRILSHGLIILRKSLTRKRKAVLDINKDINIKNKMWDIVQKHILYLSDIISADILIVNEDGICVSGTALYKERLGTQIHFDNALSYSLKTGESTFVLNPRDAEICKQCSTRHGCTEIANFTGPVIVNNKVLAVVQFVAFNQYQRINLMSKAEQSFELIKHLINFICLQEMHDEHNYTLDYEESFPDFIGKSKCMQSLKQKIIKIAPSDSTILIEGESGTGKELVAKAIHAHSLRHNKPFIPINCGAIPENLMESELFGYVEGAFSGANQKGKRGLLEEANGGTLFLDEISEMPLSLQVKLLRALQESAIRRVGGTSQSSIDIRIIAASNKNLKQSVANGLFREDLFFRLNVIPLYIQPLRERKEDIRLLTSYFLQYFSKNHHRTYYMSTNLDKQFENYSWPGNVRELKNFVEYGVNFCENNVLTLDLMHSRFSEQFTSPTYTPPTYKTEKVNAISKSLSNEEVSDNYSHEDKKLMDLLKLYQHEKGGKKKVAKAMGISLATLYRKLNAKGKSSY